MQPTEILLAEDNPGDVVLLEEALALSGWAYRLNLVSDGLEARAFLRRTGRHAGAVRPGLILLDLNLPGVGGRDLFLEIQGDPQLAGLPVFILSGSEWERAALIALGLPDSRYLVKPNSFLEYRQLVGHLQAIFRGPAAGG